MSVGDVFGLMALIFGIIAVVAILGEAYKRRLAFQQRKLEIMAGQTAEKAAQYAVRTQAIEGRLQVVERIVTDTGYDVATQIDALRDARAVAHTARDAAQNGVNAHA